MSIRIAIATLAISFCLSAPAWSQQSVPVAQSTVSIRTENYYRTELYFGRSVPGGGLVSDQDWEEFLSNIVTPLFPDGFTVLNGRGQYREASGKIAREPSHVLVFLYRKNDRKTAGEKFERIRTEYRRRFAQESILRVDSRKRVAVSF